MKAFSSGCVAARRWHGLYGTVPFTIEPASQTGLDMLRATALRGRDAALLHYFDHAITVDECDVMSDALAVALQRQGVEPGDRVAMYLQNIPQVLITVLAVWKCGAVVVPCNPMLRERELVKILSDSGSRVLICQEDLYAEVARAALPSTAVQHTITTSALDFLRRRARRCRRSWRARPGCGRPGLRICSSWSTAIAARRPSRPTSRARTSPSWSTRRARPARRKRR